MSNFFLFLIAFFLSFVLTFLVQKLALRLKILDYPGGPRKIHQKPTPLLGGLAIFLSYFLILFSIFSFKPDFFSHYLKFENILGFFLGSLILILGGILDDRFDLKPKWQILFIALASLTPIFFGVELKEVTNPFGGVLDLTWSQKEISFFQKIFIFSFPSSLITFLWFFLIINATKILDGLDGLVSGLMVIGLTLIGFLTTLTHWYQPGVGALAFLGAGAFAGFLCWNWHPAKIFLGQGGSTLAGYFLAFLSILAGSKIGIALLVFGAPIFDLFWVVIRRVFFEKKLPVYPDQKHLHHRLLEIGFSQRQAVLFLYAIAFSFGFTALFLPSLFKLLSFLFLIIILFVLALLLARIEKK